MSNIPSMPGAESLASSHSLAGSGLWPAVTGIDTLHVVSPCVLRPRRELPAYCNPVALFFAVWILMLACLSVHVSYVIYPGLATPLLIFAVSAASLLLGFFASTAVLDDPSQEKPISFLIDITRLGRMNLLFCVLALLLIAFNWLTDGPPPAIGDASTYLVYGKLKQILFPLLTCIAVNATLDTSRLRRFLFISFTVCWLGLYVARGVLLITFMQIFFLSSLRSRTSARKQLLLGLGAFAVAITGVTIIGNLRTAHDIFIAFLQIRSDYSDWPMAFLWFVSYISIPFSNLCWMVAHGSSHGPSFAFVYPLLPSFMAPAGLYSDVYGRMDLIDNASTYLQTWALDFSYLGIYFVNLAIGLGCGWLVKRAYPNNLLVLAVFLSFISLLFFSDMIFLLSTVIQVLLQLFVQKRCFRWEDSEGYFAYGNP